MRLIIMPPFRFCHRCNVISPSVATTYVRDHGYADADAVHGERI